MNTFSSTTTTPSSSQGNADLGAANPYLKGGLDTNDIIRAKLDPDFFEGYCIGTIHKRLHEATSRFRTDPQGRRARYLAVLYYAQQLAALVGAQSLGHNATPNDLSDRFSRLQAAPQSNLPPNVNPGSNLGAPRHAAQGL